MRKRSLIISLVLAGALWGLGALFASPGLAQTPITTDTFAELANKTSGAVVNISAEKVVKNEFKEFFQGQENRRGPGMGPDMPMPPEGPFRDFRDFFDKFFGEMPKSFKTRSLGSGFIIDPQGYVVTIMP